MKPTPAADMPAESPRGDRAATRRAALQALYQWLVAGTEVGDLVLQFERAGWLQHADHAFFSVLVRGVLADSVALETIYAGHLDRPPVQLDPVERAVLLLAAFELRDCPEVPCRVVLDQATELAKIFGAEGGHRFVNGVLDAIARELRPAEVSRHA